MVLTASCGSADDSSSSVTAANVVRETTAPSPPPAATSTPTEPSLAPTTTTTTTTNSTTTTTSGGTPAPGRTSTLQIPIPSGSFDVDADDLFVLTRRGDLERWSAALTSAPGLRTLVADYADPFGVVTEGPGPNVIDHVVGVVDGSVVFGDCCEPISGNVLAATGPDEVSVLAGGYSPTLSPDRGLLGTANDYVIAQTATSPSGDGIFRTLNDDPGSPYLHVVDLIWSSNATATADDDHLVVLGWTDAGWALHHVDRSTLALSSAFELGIPAVPEAPDTVVRFAGNGPDDEIIVAESSPGGTRLRAFTASTLAELPLLERSLPASATSIRVADDGLALLWVDDMTLYHLPAGELDAVALGNDVLAAWFATASVSSAPGS
jgi:hypothetical protein